MGSYAYHCLKPNIVNVGLQHFMFFPLKIANVVMVLSVDHMLVYNIYVFSIENS